MKGLPRYKHNDITVINEWKIRSVVNSQNYTYSVVTQNGTPVNTQGVFGHYYGSISSGFANDITITFEVVCRSIGVTWNGNSVNLSPVYISSTGSSAASSHGSWGMMGSNDGKDYGFAKIVILLLITQWY